MEFLLIFNSTVCYINPLKKQEAIEIVFVKPNQLSNQDELPVAKDRKFLLTLPFMALARIWWKA